MITRLLSRQLRWSLPHEVEPIEGIAFQYSKRIDRTLPHTAIIDFYLMCVKHFAKPPSPQVQNSAPYLHKGVLSTLHISLARGRPAP